MCVPSAPVPLTVTVTFRPRPAAWRGFRVSLRVPLPRVSLRRLTLCPGPRRVTTTCAVALAVSRSVRPLCSRRREIRADVRSETDVRATFRAVGRAGAAPTEGADGATAGAGLG